MRLLNWIYAEYGLTSRELAQVCGFTFAVMAGIYLFMLAIF